MPLEQKSRKGKYKRENRRGKLLALRAEKQQRQVQGKYRASKTGTGRARKKEEKRGEEV